MQLSATYEIRDPIHGLIGLTDQEVQILNTSVFQRLRRIRQLAMADLVYPGALHTRFEHSLGTLHVANRILERLDSIEHVPNDDIVAVRLAALLHDIGHGAFSHVSDYVLDEHYDKRAVGGASREKIHEKITVDVIGKAPELVKLLSEEQRRAVVNLIRGTGERDFRRDIVSSSLDADKMDYLLRDAHFAGVRYGWFDLDKVIESCRILRRDNESYLAVHEEGVYAVEQLILSKHHMTQQVYSHRVRTITDLMIVRGLELGLEADEQLRAVYTYDGSESHIERYLQMDDARLAADVLKSPDPRARTIFERLRHRRLFKELALIPIDTDHVPDSVTRGRLSKLDHSQERALETRLAEQLGREPWEIIVHRKSVKNPAYQRPGALDPEAIHSVRADGGARTLDQIETFAVATVGSAERLHVIGPRDLDPSLTQEALRQAAQELEQSITELILKRVGG